jgi:hypothetical protein
MMEKSFWLAAKFLPAPCLRNRLSGGKTRKRNASSGLIGAVFRFTNPRKIVYGFSEKEPKLILSPRRTPWAGIEERERIWVKRL